MPGKSELYREIDRQYERIRQQKSIELRQRKERIYTAIPRILEIEQEMATVGVKVAQLVLGNPQNLDNLIRKLQKRLQLLKEEKKELLQEKGFCLQDMELKYECPKCKDTGYVELQPCVCRKQKLMDATYDQSNIRQIIKVENFDHFDFRFYSDTIDEKEGISPRQNIENIIKEYIDFVKNFDTEFSNLLLYGKTGLGKTFLCNCIAKELLDKGKIVLYVTAGQLFKLIEDQRFHRNEEEEQKDYMADILEADLLIIDDLGTEFSTILSSSELFQIINTRMLNKKPVIISTNLAPSDLVNQYSDRIVSRLMGEYTSLKFFGEDIRVKKKYL